MSGRERLDLHKAIYIMFFANCAARRLRGWREGDRVTCLHAGGGAARGGRAGPKQGTPGLHAALHWAVAFPAGLPGPFFLPCTIQAPSVVRRASKGPCCHSSPLRKTHL